MQSTLNSYIRWLNVACRYISWRIWLWICKTLHVTCLHLPKMLYLLSGYWRHLQLCETLSDWIYVRYIGPTMYRNTTGHNWTVWLNFSNGNIRNVHSSLCTRRYLNMNRLRFKGTLHLNLWRSRIRQSLLYLLTPWQCHHMLCLWLRWWCQQWRICSLLIHNNWCLMRLWHRSLHRRLHWSLHLNLHRRLHLRLHLHTQISCHSLINKLIHLVRWIHLKYEYKYSEFYVIQNSAQQLSKWNWQLLHKIKYNTHGIMQEIIQEIMRETK